jgi:pimeloyl-ACP methyl ester carboxylesterase
MWKADSRRFEDVERGVLTMRSDLLRALRCGLIIGAGAFALQGQHSTTPVLLVNGFQLICPDSGSFGPDSGTFGQLAPILLQDGASSVESFDVCASWGAPIETLAGLLSAKIQSYSGPVDVIAHSMGGLVVRAYLQGRTTGPYLIPPANPNIHKLVLLGTPNAGVSNVFNLLPSAQVNEMVFGSPFLWALGTWNQLSDDLRGISTLAVAGTAGINAGGIPWDGIVDVSSASLDFADSSGALTRAVPYCHTSAAELLCSAGAPLIAYVSDRNHLSYRLIRSFLDGTNDWMGVAPQASQASSTGGMRVTLSGASGGFYGSGQLSGVSLANNGVVYPLVNPVPGSPVWTNNGLPAGQNYTVTMDLAGQLFTVSGVSLLAGGFLTLPLKFTPSISEVLPSPGIPQGELSVAAGSLISLLRSGAG